MGKKNVLVIILTVLVFLSAATLGVSTVYRVDEVTVKTSVVSEAAKTEAEELQRRLQETYQKRSTFFADQALADEVVASFPYFRITSFEKDYPNRLVFQVTEDGEMYAVPCLDDSDQYYILNAEGLVLAVRSDPANRSDGGANVILKGSGNTALTATGARGELLSGDDCLPTLFAFVNEISVRLDGIRRNVVSVEVERPASNAKETVFKLTMKEGVKIYVRDPFSLTSEKAQRAIDEYLSLSDKKKLSGMIAVWDDTDGVNAGYYERDGLE